MTKDNKPYTPKKSSSKNNEFMINYDSNWKFDKSSKSLYINLNKGNKIEITLTDDINVPKERSEEQMGTGIPITYVPARNTIFLSYALGWAEVLGSSNIHLGVNILDYSGYPDCRPEYIKAFEAMANLATKASTEGEKKLSIHTPLINLSKSEIIQKGIDLGVDYSLTSSCYDPSSEGEPCGGCDSCQLRNKGFAEIGIEDPLIQKFKGR